MKDIQYTTKKTAFDLRKNSLNNKIFNVNTTPNSNFIPKQQMLVKQMNSMGKKYMQDNIFKRDREQFLKEKQKPHRQVVMSQEFIKSSKLYKLMKQKIDRSDTMHIKQVNVLNEVIIQQHQTKLKLKQQIMQMKSENYQNKISLWELKNKIMELKMMYNEEQEQNKRLIQQERIYQQQQEEEEQGEEGPYSEEGTYQGQQLVDQQNQTGQIVNQQENQQCKLQKEQQEAEGPLYVQQQKQMQTKIKFQKQQQQNENKQEHFHTNSNPQIHSEKQLEKHFYHDFSKRNKEKVLFVMKPKPHQTNQKHKKQQQQNSSEEINIQQVKNITKQKNIEKDMLGQNEQNLQEQKIKSFQQLQIQRQSQQVNLVHKFIDFSILNNQAEDQLFNKLKIELGISQSQQINEEKNNTEIQNSQNKTNHNSYT